MLAASCLGRRTILGRLGNLTIAGAPSGAVHCPADRLSGQSGLGAGRVERTDCKFAPREGATLVAVEDR
jgi:hypothetical protein